MQNKKKRLLAFLLALTLLVGLYPAVALASEAEEPEAEPTAVLPSDEPEEEPTEEPSEEASEQSTENTRAINPIVPDEGGVVRRTYYFYDGDTIVSTQIVKNGEYLFEPELPARENERFLGWSADGGESFQSFDAPVTDIDDTAESDEEVKLYALFAPALAVIFHDRDGSVISCVEGKSGDTVGVDDVRFTLLPGEAVVGWTRDADSGLEGRVQGSVTLENSSIDLYPLTKGVGWLVFRGLSPQDPDPTAASYTAPFYVPAQEAAEEPAAPSRLGYSFRAWTTDEAGEEPFDFSSVPEGVTELFAQWTPEETSYQIVVWKEQLVDFKYVEGNYEQVLVTDATALSGSTVTFDGDNELVQSLLGTDDYLYYELPENHSSALVRGDGKTIVNVYFNLKLYTIRFYASYWGDGTEGNRFAYRYKKYWHTKYNVAGWLDISFTDPDGVTHHGGEYYELKAHFGEYIRDRWPDYGTGAWALTADVPEDFTAPGTKYKAEDGSIVKVYGHDAWFNEFNSGLTDDLGGSFNSAQPLHWRSYEKTGNNTEVSTTWQTYLRPNMIIGDGSQPHNLVLTFSIGGMNEYKVTYWYENADDDSFEKTSEKTSYNPAPYDKSTLYAPVADKRYTYLGDGETPSEEYPATEKLSGIYHFYGYRTRWELHFYNDGIMEKAYEGEDKIKWGASIEDLIYEPERPATVPEQFQFAGWYTDESFAPDTKFEKEGAKMPCDPLTLYAKWEGPTFRVDFDAAGGSPVASQTVFYSKTAAEPEEPQREGFRFVGWELNGELFRFDTEIYKDITLTARWYALEPIYVVYDAAEHGTNPPEDENAYLDGSEALTRGAPEANEGYSFIGWLLDGKLYKPGELFPIRAALVTRVRAADSGLRIVLVAQYEKLPPEVNITFRRNHPAVTGGDTAAYTTEYKRNNSEFLLPAPDELNFPASSDIDPARWEFLGWSTTPDGKGGYIFPAGRTVSADVTSENILYALWQAKEVPPTPTPDPTPTPTPDPTPTPTPDPTPTPTPTGKPNGPKTGDEANLALWSALALGSLLSLAGVWYLSRRKAAELE